MKNYDPEFLKQLEKVDELRKTLQDEEKKLQELCPHVELSGVSAVRKGRGHQDCRLCGQSDYYIG